MIEQRGYCVVKGINKEPVAVDTGSGGYPYPSTNPAALRIWHTQMEADKYVQTMDGFKGEKYETARCVLTFTVLPL